MTDFVPWTFGEEPLTETMQLATAVRELVGIALSLERPTSEIRDLTDTIRSACVRLGAHVPRDSRPRIGPHPQDDRRVYIDHSRNIGDYNPFFPQYRVACADGRAEGEVEFPVAYEGPPGIVHGGFLALLFDCVLQQLNCDLGTAGKTAGISVRYRRPTPLLTLLRVTASREIVDRRTHSTAQLSLGDDVLCEAEMSAVAGTREALPAVSPRRA
jgi:hypothetical protein